MRTAIAVCLLTLFAVGVAHADSHMEGPPPRDKSADELPPQTEFFDEYDANADGAVSRDEYPHSAESFRLLDKDKDGKISTTELGLPADYRPDPQAAKKRKEIRGREQRGDGLAGGARDRIYKMLQKMDKNGDNAVSREEWTGRPEMFDRVDRNKDGVLDAKDRQRAGKDDKAAFNEAIKKRFDAMDKDADGALSPDELQRPDALARLDGDGDGTVSFEEFKSFASRMRGRDNRGGRRGRALTEQQLRRFDRDGDGKVVRDEFPGSDRVFERLDANKDGVLNAEDIQKKSDKPAKKEGVTTESASLIQTHDKDGDGKLNRAEFPGTAEAWKQLDRNGDGWVTKDEVGEK